MRNMGPGSDPFSGVPVDARGTGGVGGVQIYGPARDLTVALTPDQQSLLISLVPNKNGTFMTDANYIIYWLDPNIYSQSDIYQPQNEDRWLYSRMKVADLSGGQGVISVTLPYLPFITGGWMYAVAVPPNGTREFPLDGTNVAAVPVIGTAGLPLTGEAPVNPWVLITNIGGTSRQVQFGWTNAKSLVTVGYVKISMLNYFNDGEFQDIAIYRINTSPGARQGIPAGATSWNLTGNSVILEPDNGVAPGHALTFYFVPMSPALTPLPYSLSPTYATTAIV